MLPPAVNFLSTVNSPINTLLNLPTCTVTILLRVWSSNILVRRKMVVFYITCQSLVSSDLVRGVHALTNGEAMRCPMKCASPVLRLQWHARSFACLTHFSRWTKKKRDWSSSNLPKVIVSSLIGYFFTEYRAPKNQTRRQANQRSRQVHTYMQNSSHVKESGI